MMEAVIKLKELKEKYPKWVTLFPGITSSMIPLAGSINDSLKEEVIELLRFTNGFSVLDYSFGALKNPKVMSLDIFSNDDLIIIQTSGDEEYGIRKINDSESIVFRNYCDDYGEIHEQLISKSINKFLLIFLEKSHILLESFKSGDIVMYFDDPSLPENLNEWNGLEN